MSPELTAEAAVKELAAMVRTHVGDLRARHHMINLLAGISGTLFVLRQDLQEDIVAEMLETQATVRP